MQQRNSQGEGRRKRGALLLALTAGLGAPVAAQEAGIEALERRVEALEAEQAAEMRAWSRQLEAVQNELEAVRAESSIPPQAYNLFNPAITVLGTFTGRVDDKPAFEDDDATGERIDDRFALREVEIDLRAPISPWAEGVLRASFEAEGGGFDTGIEEGYLTFGRLPLLDVAPGGLRVKAGHFRPNFGRLNRVHLHDLPQPTYPRSLQRFFGDDGYMQTGLSGEFFLPSPGDTVSVQGTVELLNGGDLPAAAGAPASDAAVLGQLRTFAELTDASTLDLGASAWSDGGERSIYGLDATYKWAPPSQGTWHSFLLGSELFLGDFDQPGLDPDPMGYYVYAQYQFNSSTYLGVRYDHSQELADADLETSIYGTYLTRYTAEFLRFRLGYEHAVSDLSLVDGRDTLILEINYAFGAHPVEPYWVHR